MAIDNNFGKTDDTEKAKGRHDRENSFPLYKLFSFPDRADIVLMSVGGIAAFLNGLTIPLITLIFGQLVDTFGRTTRNNIVEEVSKDALKFVYLGIGSALATCVQMSCWMITGERQSERIRNMYLKAVLRQDIAFFDTETNMGEVVGKMSGDIVLIQDAMGEKVGKSIQLTSSFTGGFVVAFSRGWLLVLVMMSTVPFLILSGAIMSMAITLMATREQEAYSRAAAHVEQTIGSIKTVASFTGEREAMNQYNKSLNRSYKSSVLEGLAAGLGMGLVLFVIFCSYGLAVWSGSRFIIERGYTGGEVVNVVIAIVTCSMSLGEASPCVKAFAAGKAAAFNMFETIERKPEIDSSDTGGLKLEDIKGDIELKEICFRYPTRPHEQIFDGLSLSIPSGDTVALVGESGSGKSTVISLIQRFYDPQAGEILIDGINLKEYQIRWIREKMGLVGQEPVLFASSIKDNIAYGKDSSTIEEIKAAAKLANAATFIDKLPQGLETMVGDYGTQLSGGQKQRVAIARAILRNPRILLLDEATSALDTESERSVQEALDRIMTSRTTIVVAHRLSTVKNSDMIAVVHNGKIVEKGPHSKLIELNGAYSQLISLQEEKKVTNNYHDKPVCTLVSPRRSPHCVSFEEQSGVQDSPNTLHLSAVVEDEPTELTNRQTPQQSKDVPLRRLINLNRPEFPMLILGCVFAVINGSVLPVFGLLFSNMIEKFYEPPDMLRKDSTLYMKLFVALAFVSLIASTARSYFFAVAGSQLIRRVRSMSFEKILHMEIGWFDSTVNSSSAIGSKLSIDAATVRGLVGDTLALIVQNLSSLLLGLAIALQANWQLALVVVALVPLLVFNTWAYMKFMRGFSADAKVMYGEASKVANDAVRNIRTVASFSAEEKVMDLYRKRCKIPKEAGIKLGLVTGGAFGLSFFFLLCSYAISFYVGSRLIQDGKAEFVQVFRVFFALCMAAMAVSMASTITPDTTKAKACTASVFEMLDRKSLIDSNSNTGKTLEHVKGCIEFQHVSFTYPMRPTALILQDFDLTIEAGKMVALVGESGCGKSTVISLLQRFYNPNSGQILLDGTEIQKFQVRWLRQQMGLVGQEPLLFNDTIRANIAYGKEGEATEAEILAAAEAANAHKFISAMDQGYDTLVGERGVQLSGGQKQRVAIARAIVKAPKFLLLDEATSALDAESERVVQNALDQVMINRTTIIVAHRLSTIKGASMIAVIKNGVVVEKGRHAELLDIKDGCYASLSAVHTIVS